MSTGSHPRCICSTVGYQAQTWSKDYYPEDCPQAWQLAYFMNDFPGVYLPEDTWPDAEQLSAITDELEGEFMLVLEWPSAASKTRCRLRQASAH